VLISKLTAIVGSGTQALRNIRGVLRERMRPTVFPQGSRAQAGVKGTQRATNHEAMAEPCCRVKQMKKGTTDQ
tara:strand:- start:4029 stop:4247 length:219 start_codon:yes stop_codon:yes gene_type:complete